jgi:hypothetical protein
MALISSAVTLLPPGPTGLSACILVAWVATWAASQAATRASQSPPMGPAPPQAASVVATRNRASFLVKMGGLYPAHRSGVAGPLRRCYGRSAMRRILIAVVLVSLLLLSSCGRLLRPGGQPTPGPTSTPSPTGTGVAGGGDEGSDDAPADEAVTDGPEVTG